MSELSDKLRDDYLDQITGELKSEFVKEIDTVVFWKPITGKQNKTIQKAAAESTADGICMHVKIRALDKNGDRLFKDTPVISLMNDFDFASISAIFFAMTGNEYTTEDMEGN